MTRYYKATRPALVLAALDGPERPTAPATPTTDGGAA